MILCPVCHSSNVQPVFEVYDDRYGHPGVFPIKKCSGCQHKFLVHTMGEADISELYTKYYPRSSAPTEHQELPSPTGFLSWFNGSRRAYAFVPPNVRVLDIGCGTGDSLFYHARRGCEAYGIEADRNVERIANERGLNIKIGPFSPRYFQEKYFDCVTMDQVLEHTVDPLKTLRDVHSLLKHNGSVIITVPNGNGWGQRVFKQTWIHWHCPYHLHHFSKKSLIHLFQQAGFEIKKIKSCTSSDWLYYQQLHLAHFPSVGKRSTFWSTNETERPTDPKKKWIIKVARALHRTKINHLITRMADGLSIGDNLLLIAKKI